MGIGNTRHRGNKNCRCGRLTCGICCPRGSGRNNNCPPACPTGPQGIPGPTGPCCTGPAGPPGPSGGACKDFKWSGAVDATLLALILDVGAVLADNGIVGIPSLPITPLFPYPVYPVPAGVVCARVCTTLVGGENSEGLAVPAVIVALNPGTNLHFQLFQIDAAGVITPLCENVLPIPQGLGIAISDPLILPCCDNGQVPVAAGTRIGYRVFADGPITITGSLFVAATGA